MPTNLHPQAPIDSVCILRLSALGDVCHVVPLVRSLQRQSPGTRITWIVGKFEHRLVGTMADVEFIAFDKRAGLQAFAALRRQLRGRRFAALLHMQVALRANLVSSLITAQRRIGYDPARSKDLHGLFINERIAANHGQHVLDAMGSFLRPLGLEQNEVRWDLPISAAARALAEQVLPGDQPTLLISPCSSHVLRNWHAAGYAAVAEHAIHAHGYRVLLCGGPSPLERQVGDAIVAACRLPLLDMIGKDTLPQLLALLERADMVLSPDSGPMHLANAVGTPVIGLHAASNPARSGPYSDRRFCIDRYAAAARKYRGRPADQLPWGTKIEVPGVMDLIEIDAVIEAFERCSAAAMARRRRGDR